MRAFLLKVGKQSEIGSEVFFLYTHELPLLLGSSLPGGEPEMAKKQILRHLPDRKQNYERYRSLPKLPMFIKGRFDPFEWAKRDNRRVDYFDAAEKASSYAASSNGKNGLIHGFAGAAGVIEGTVRILSSYEEQADFQPGEILVTSTTNVGWTPLFPRAAAIVTDIGAPLSHAAIVARELGIPAVVGCGDATTRLKTGDRVQVDGGHGIVQKIS
jgi:pyruvate,water dikinase